MPSSSVSGVEKARTNIPASMAITTQTTYPASREPPGLESDSTMPDVSDLMRWLGRTGPFAAPGASGDRRTSGSAITASDAMRSRVPRTSTPADRMEAA